jgi:ABC-type transport system substrate-binding protein
VDQKQRAAVYGEVAREIARDLPSMWFVFGKDPFVYQDRFVGLPTPAYGFSGWYDEIWSRTGQ